MIDTKRIDEAAGQHAKETMNNYKTVTSEALANAAAILEAYKAGKTIQRYDTLLGHWDDIIVLDKKKPFHFEPNTLYRISPKYDYRPFANDYEVGMIMREHEPYGLIVRKNYLDEEHVIGTTPEGRIMLKSILVGSCCGFATFDKAFDEYTFPDDVPFGWPKDRDNEEYSEQ